MAMTLNGFSDLRKRTHGQNIIAVIDQVLHEGVRSRQAAAAVWSTSRTVEVEVAVTTR
jgi:hypothetical protein